MADGKDIEIRIAATGGDQAAAEIKKVETAATDAAGSGGGSTGFGGMLDGVPERAEEAAESVAKVTKSLEELKAEAAQAKAEVGGMADEMDDASDQAGKLDENVSKIARAQRAQAVAQLAEVLGQVGAKMRKSADEVKDSDPQMASSLKNMADNIDQVSSTATAMALGFAAGGPVGAGVALVGKLAVEAAGAFFDLAASFTAADAAQARAAETAQKLAKWTQEGADAASDAAEAAAELAGRYDKQTEALNAYNDALARTNRIQDAKDQADSARRDLTDAAAIRNGAPREDVEAARARDNATVEKARIDRDLEKKRLAVVQEQAANREERERIDRERINPDADGKALDKSESKLGSRETSNAKAELDYRAEAEQARLKKQAIDDRAELQVRNLAEAKTRREASEKQKADDQAKRTSDQAKAAADRQRDADDKARKDALSTAGRTGKEAEKALPPGVSDKFRKSVEAASARLQDGAQGSELDELANLMAQLGNSTNSGLNGFRSAIAKVQGEIEILKKQIKNR